MALKTESHAFAGMAEQASANSSSPLVPKSPHHRAKAKRVIQIFCPGGMSQVDTYDYKPELEKRSGKPFDPDGNLQFFASKPGNCRGSHWKFRRHGQSGGQHPEVLQEGV